jgi:hypothetical protein
MHADILRTIDELLEEKDCRIKHLQEDVDRMSDMVDVHQKRLNHIIRYKLAINDKDSPYQNTINIFEIDLYTSTEKAIEICLDNGNSDPISFILMSDQAISVGNKLIQVANELKKEP